MVIHYTEALANRNVDGDREPSSFSSDSRESNDSSNHSMNSNACDSDATDETDKAEDEEVNNWDADKEVMEAQAYVAEFFEGYRSANLLGGPGKVSTSLACDHHCSNHVEIYGLTRHLTSRCYCFLERVNSRFLTMPSHHSETSSPDLLYDSVSKHLLCSFRSL